MLEVGIDNWEIIPLLTYPCDQKTIFEFERNWIKMLNPDLNTNSPLNSTNKQENDEEKEARRRHYFNNIESKRYYCEICNKSFGKIFNLQRHLNSLKHDEKVKSCEFEQLLTNVHEMIQNGTFSQVLGNSRETYL